MEARQFGRRLDSLQTEQVAEPPHLLPGPSSRCHLSTAHLFKATQDDVASRLRETLQVQKLLEKTLGASEETLHTNMQVLKSLTMITQ